MRAGAAVGSGRANGALTSALRLGDSFDMVAAISLFFPAKNESKLLVGVPISTVVCWFGWRALSRADAGLKSEGRARFRRGDGENSGRWMPRFRGLEVRSDTCVEICYSWSVGFAETCSGARRGTALAPQLYHACKPLACGVVLGAGPALSFTLRGRVFVLKFGFKCLFTPKRRESREVKVVCSILLGKSSRFHNAEKQYCLSSKPFRSNALSDHSSRTTLRAAACERDSFISTVWNS